MNKPTPKTPSPEPAQPDAPRDTRSNQRPDWETPKLEDVSEQVMAQPYIRFT
jgi:hypothetical protein